MNEFGKLELSTETIRELSADEMDRVAGGAARDTIVPTCQCTGIYPSINYPCPSVRECFQYTTLCTT